MFTLMAQSDIKELSEETIKFSDLPQAVQDAFKNSEYAEWEIGMNERNVWPLDPIFHRELVKDALRTARLRPYVFFIYGYILKGGFLHGKVGLDYALKRFSYNRRISRAARQTSD